MTVCLTAVSLAFSSPAVFAAEPGTEPEEQTGSLLDFISGKGLGAMLGAMGIEVTDELLADIRKLMDASWENVEGELPSQEEAAEYLIEVREMIRQGNLAEEEIAGILDRVLEELDITVTEDIKASLVKTAQDISVMEASEEDIRDIVAKAYSFMEGSSEDGNDLLGMAGSFLSGLFG